MAKRYYYGELIITETKNSAEINIEFIGRDVIIALPESIIDERNKIKQFFDIMGKYIEIDENAIKYILKSFPQKKKVKMEYKYYYINLENKRMAVFGIIKENVKVFIEKRINQEMKLSGDE